MTDQVILFAGGTTFHGLAPQTPVDYDWANLFRVQVWHDLGDGSGFFQPYLPMFDTAVGIEYGFVQSWLETHPDGTLYFGKLAPKANFTVAQTGGIDWSPDSTGELFDHAANIANSMLQYLGADRLDAVFLGVGGYDGQAPFLAADLDENLARLFDAIREEWMHDEDGHIGFTNTPLGIGPFEDANLTVRAAQETVGLEDPVAEMVDTTLLQMGPGRMMFSAEALAEVGQTLFDNFLT